MRRRCCANYRSDPSGDDGSGVADSQHILDCPVVTDVTFRTLTDEDIAGYVASGEPLDKAGAYGIPGAGWLFCQEDKWQLSRRSRLYRWLKRMNYCNFNALREKRINMTAELLVNVTPSETRVAYIDGGILQENSY
ncbi:hypothetical protein DMH88_08995 [Escherichia coli]|nr:hypothetical protein [Escherichia coli]